METTQTIHVFINNHEYLLEQHKQTGAHLKQLAGIPSKDVLFLEKPREDEIIDNETMVILKNGDRLFSQPPADYGLVDVESLDVGLNVGGVTAHDQPGGWTFLELANYELPEGFEPRSVRLLVKLPPMFPEAAPDMFWVSPSAILSNGRVPRSTSSEHLMGEDWQRFSWHLTPGAWKPGSSTLRDFLRCIRGRLLRKD